MALPIGDLHTSPGPYGEAVILTTNSTTTLTPISRALYFSAAGTTSFMPAFSTVTCTITVVAGSMLPIKAQAVYSAPANSYAFW